MTYLIIETHLLPPDLNHKIQGGIGALIADIPQGAANSLSDIIRNANGIIELAATNKAPQFSDITDFLVRQQRTYLNSVGVISEIAGNEWYCLPKGNFKPGQMLEELPKGARKLR